MLSQSRHRLNSAKAIIAHSSAISLLFSIIMFVEQIEISCVFTTVIIFVFAIAIIHVSSVSSTIIRLIDVHHVSHPVVVFVIRKISSAFVQLVIRDDFVSLVRNHFHLHSINCFQLIFFQQIQLIVY